MFRKQRLQINEILKHLHYSMPLLEYKYIKNLNIFKATVKHV